MNKCGGCGKFLSGGVPCTKCKTNYHRQCVNIHSNQTPKNWLCPCCFVNVPRTDNTNMPVKDNMVTQDPVQSPQSIEESSGQRAILDEIRALRNDMNDFRSDFGGFRKEVHEEIKDLRSLYQRCDDKMEYFAECLEKQESRLVALETTYTEVHNLKSQICELKRELGDRDQLSLLNDLEISGVTENKGENTMQILGLLLNKIGQKFDEHDVVEARRVGPVRIGQDGRQSARPIVVRVTRRAVRDEVLRAARSRRNLTTAELNLAGTLRPVYINERLTKENRLLFGRARSLCKHNSWKFAWTRDGKIFIREGDGKTAFRIHSEGNFARIHNFSFDIKK